MSSLSIMQELKQEIASWIKSRCPDVEESLILGALESPKLESHGDCSLPMPKLRLKGNPKELASRLASEFQPFGRVVKAAAVDAFLNFTWDKRDIVRQAVPAILKEGSKYGHNNAGDNKTVLIEYGSPNIAKPFHAGHLRSAVLGNFLKHVYAANGYRVVGINYLGDWGKQYGLLALGYERYGNDDELQQDAIKHLFDVYVRINEDAEKDATVHDTARLYFRRMEDGDESILKRWRQFRDLSIVKYREVYQRLNIEHDVYHGESFYEEGMKTAISMLRQLGLLEESQGSQVVDLSAEKLGMSIIVKRDGATLYLTRDIAAAIARWDEYHFHRSIYVVGATQDFHLKQLFAILKKMGFSWADRCEHVNYGLVRGMSTRKGTAVFLEDILNETTDVMHAVMQSNSTKYSQIVDPLKTAELLALSAIVVQDASAKRIKDYDFNWARMTSFEGDTGPYLQYAHTRLCSIERKVPEILQLVLEAQSTANFDAINFDLLHEEQAQGILMTLLKFPQVVIDACRTQEPCLVVTFLMNVAHQLSSLIESLYVMNQPKDIAVARLALFMSVRQVLGNGLSLLGLIPLTQM